MMRLLMIFICAQLLNLPAAIAAENFGRLFTTPAERSNLDYSRQIKKAAEILKPEPAIVEETKVEALPTIAHAPVVLPDAISVQGYVKRNDGKQSTVWVNDEAMQEGTGNEEVQVGKLPTQSNRVPIKLQANGKRFTLKAGQVYNPDSNRVRELRANTTQDDAGRIGDEDTP